MLRVATTAVLLSPRLTGQFQSSWEVTTGEPAGGRDGPGARIESTQATIARVRREIKAHTGDGDLTIATRVSYALALDRGSSRKAPNGFSRLARLSGEGVSPRAFSTNLVITRS